jgi:hypothetical protein
LLKFNFVLVKGERPCRFSARRLIGLLVTLRLPVMHLPQLLWAALCGPFFCVYSKTDKTNFKLEA